MEGSFKCSFMVEWVNWKSSDKLLVKESKSGGRFKAFKEMFLCGFWNLAWDNHCIEKIKDIH